MSRRWHRQSLAEAPALGSASRSPLPALLMLSVAISGCMVGPDYKRPPVVQPAGFKSTTASGDAPLVAPEWWRLHREPELDRLVATANESNQTLQQAVAAVDQARALARIARSYLAPTISTNPTFTRQRTSGESRQQLLGPARRSQRHVQRLAGSHRFDLRGRRLGPCSARPRIGPGASRRQRRRCGHGAAHGPDRRRAVLLLASPAGRAIRDPGANRRLVPRAGAHPVGSSQDRAHEPDRAVSSRRPAAVHPGAATGFRARPRRPGTRPGDSLRTAGALVLGRRQSAARGVAAGRSRGAAGDAARTAARCRRGGAGGRRRQRADRRREGGVLSDLLVGQFRRDSRARTSTTFSTGKAASRRSSPA